MNTCGCGDCNTCGYKNPLMVSGIDECNECNLPSLLSDCAYDCEKICDTCDGEHCGKSCCDGGKKRPVRFTCRMGPAQSKYCDEYGEVIYISGKHTPRVHMKKGRKYVWRSEGVTGGLILTLSSTGGTEATPIFSGAFTDEYGELCIWCDENLPNEFYYQSRTQTNKGGVVIVD